MCILRFGMENRCSTIQDKSVIIQVESKTESTRLRTLYTIQSLQSTYIKLFRLWYCGNFNAKTKQISQQKKKYKASLLPYYI